MLAVTWCSDPGAWPCCVCCLATQVPGSPAGGRFLSATCVRRVAYYTPYINESCTLVGNTVGDRRNRYQSDSTLQQIKASVDKRGRLGSSPPAEMSRQ